MEAIFYLINYIFSCVIFILFICWIFYLGKAIKYRKSSCEKYEAEIITFKGNTVGKKFIYEYKYVLDNINYFGDVKTKEQHNIGDKVEIFYKRNTRSESISKKDHSKLLGNILGFILAWIICNILFIIGVYGQYLFYNM